MQLNVQIRHFFVWLHRWTGLALAGFLVIVGLTGSLLAFNTELERLISPQLFAQPHPGASRLDLATLAERAEAFAPQARVEGVYDSLPDQIAVEVSPRKDPTTGEAYALGFNQIFLDPWTGEALGKRMRGDISEGWINLMPFIYRIHWELALGPTGMWILGIAAIIWTLDCFNGFYLTLPIALTAFWRRWKPSWLVKTRAGFFRVNFDLHRAGGLWLWPMLLIFAWSSVMMNVKPVYIWATWGVFGGESPWAVYFNSPPRLIEEPRLDWRTAQETGERLLAEQAALHGFAIDHASGLNYIASLGFYGYSAHSSLDVATRGGDTSVLIDSETGALRSVDLPTGRQSGATVTSWLYALHMANVFGMPYRIFVCVLGLAITMLSATGVYIWWKKRCARRAAAARSPLPANVEAAATWPSPAALAPPRLD
ncbi:PepSY-associated TM helix domain-containing protein [Methylocapsa acidiphila]|uniref:PepSY-associated TM helix domain-containing protein n=1 Tax=Methylocapsa acidiphila TaxID=133552 RepID=UPI000408395F|nr:PepSY-associated TM helix domain-containing protein [Methylocapsa acidiphila]